MNATTVLKSLQRDDKWYLGGGNRLLWAPEFPLHLDVPGFWDKASYYNFEFAPLFTWSLLDESGSEISLEAGRRSWDPSCLKSSFRSKGQAGTLSVTERKCVLPNNVAVSEITVRNTSRKRRRLHLVAWTAVESSDAQEMLDVREKGSAFTFAKVVRRKDFPDFRFGCSFGLAGRAITAASVLSEGKVPLPKWALTPFSEDFPFPTARADRKVSAKGIMFVAFRRTLRLGPAQSTTAVAAWSCASSALEAESHLRLILKQRDPVRLSVLNWADHLSSVPQFSSDDPFFEQAYWYRWYGLKLNTVLGGEERLAFPFVCEGIGYFRAPITYSAPCHMLENRWMHDAELARGSLLTFIDNQRPDGGFYGYLDINHYRQEMFYHANWGRAVLALDGVHPSMEFLQKAYAGLKKLAGYYDTERDSEVSGLYDIDNHYETGQEYSSRYLAVSKEADQTQWGEVFRLKGVDVTVYVYELKSALAAIADKLGLVAESELWAMESSKIREAVRRLMWDADHEMFYDVDPATGIRTRVKSAVSFYPYFTDIVDETHLAGLRRHLFSKREFWTPVPVPSLAADDPRFSARPEWKSKRMLCPWNGRVWPMTNSHVAEALASVACRFEDAVLRRRAAELITKFCRMMFFNGDPHRPNSFEHYNPINGAPSVYRGIDDYQHSWIVDLIIQYVCGIRPGQFSVTIDPLPFSLKRAALKNVQIRGRRIDFSLEGKRFRVTVDGKQTVTGTVGRALTLQI